MVSGVSICSSANRLYNKRRISRGSNRPLRFLDAGRLAFTMRTPTFLLTVWLSAGGAGPLPQPPEMPLMRVVDLNAREPAEVFLQNGTTARIELLERAAVSDNVSGQCGTHAYT
jgi:hypothetical protein